MRIRLKIFFVSSVLLLSWIQINAQVTPKSGNNHPVVERIEVKRVLHTSNYTYLQAEVKNELKWIAIPKMEEAMVGNHYYFQGGIEMGEFKSTELDTVFSSILFSNGVIDSDIVEGGDPSATPQHPAKEEAEIVEVSINPAQGGISIAELFENKKKYQNKVVKIKGKVTKYNSGIMGMNWVHLEDGTGRKNGFDFTATTDNELKLKDIITIEGIISLDKDFGAGYFYEVIMESAKVVE